MAVYAAALFVLATARLPDPSASIASPQAALAEQRPPSRPTAEPALGLRLILGAVFLVGVTLEVRRHTWR
jgi:hypothetical protein